MQFLQEGVIRQVFDLEKGIWYTLKGLLKYPGKMVYEYLEGKRRSHFNPIALLLIIGSIYYLIEGYSEASMSEIGFLPSESPDDFMERINSVASKYQRLFILIGLPFSALVSMFIFRRGELNLSLIHI